MIKIKKFNDSGHGASKKRKSEGGGPSNRSKKSKKFCKLCKGQNRAKRVYQSHNTVDCKLRKDDKDTSEKLYSLIKKIDRRQKKLEKCQRSADVSDSNLDRS